MHDPDHLTMSPLERSIADEAGRAMLRRSISGLSSETEALATQIAAMPDGRFQLERPTRVAIADHLDLAERELTRALRILDDASARLQR